MYILKSHLQQQVFKLLHVSQVGLQILHNAGSQMVSLANTSLIKFIGWNIFLYFRGNCLPN